MILYFVEASNDAKSTIFSIAQTLLWVGTLQSSQTQKLFKIAHKAIVVLYFGIEKMKEEELKTKNLPIRTQFA